MSERNKKLEMSKSNEEPEWYTERKEYNQNASEQGWPYWRVIVRLDCTDDTWRERIFGAHAPHRAAAKKRVRELLDDECNVTEWCDTYQPRPSWDCPNCGTHECMSTVPNMRGKWDWECRCCSYRTVGHPQDPDEETGTGSERW